MKVYKIKNQKDFTSKLFLGNVFDNFLVTECNFVKDFEIIIDGRKPETKEQETELAEKVSEEDAFANVDECVAWSCVRELAFFAIKGKELPKSFKVVLKLTKANTSNTLKALEIKDIEGTGMFINIRYNDGELTCISGTSTKEFFLTKELDKGWDAFVQKFFEKNEIEFDAE